MPLGVPNRFYSEDSAVYFYFRPSGGRRGRILVTNEPYIFFIKKTEAHIRQDVSMCNC